MSDNIERFKTFAVISLVLFAFVDEIWEIWNACGLYVVGAPFKIFMDYLRVLF